MPPKASRHAGQGLEQLREGVERAARSVLGDETAALEASPERARGPGRPARSRDRAGHRKRAGESESQRIAMLSQDKGVTPETVRTGSNNRARIRR